MTMIRPRSDVVYGICRGLPSGFTLGYYVAFRTRSIKLHVHNGVHVGLLPSRRHLIPSGEGIQDRGTFTPEKGQISTYLERHGAIGNPWGFLLLLLI